MFAGKQFYLEACLLIVPYLNVRVYDLGGRARHSESAEVAFPLPWCAGPGAHLRAHLPSASSSTGPCRPNAQS